MAMIRPETEMKDSGIEYVGAIPKDWDLVRLRAYFGERKNKNKDGNETNLLSLSYGRVIRKNIDKTDGLLPASFNTYNIVEKNDIIIRPTDLQNDKRSLRTGLVTEHGTITSAYIDLMPIGNVDSRFVHYLLHSYDILKVFYNMGSGVRQGLNYSEFSKLKVPMPLLSEQQAIADYLDETCFKIDEIIAEAKASIDEYKELKQSVIFEAVTKGLDKNVKMKDSGVEWIGKIPKKWTLYRLKHLLRSPMQYGANATGLEYDETMPRYVRITDIDSNGNLKDVGKQSLSWDVAEPYLLEDGDLLLARSGGTVGKTFLYKKSYGTCAFAGYLIRAKANDKVLPEYIHYYTLSKGYEIWKNGIFIKATIQNIGADKYAYLPIPIPIDIEIQREIVKYLDSKCITLDSLIAEKESLIADLEAYKKSLIYEVVTGKRRVV